MSGFRFSHHISDGIGVLCLSGSLTDSLDALKIQEQVKAFVNDGIRMVVVDLEGLKRINSTGLGSLMASLSTLRQNGGNLCLAAVQDKVYYILQMTKLVEVFQLHQSLPEAISYLRSQSSAT